MHVRHHILLLPAGAASPAVLQGGHGVHGDLEQAEEENEVVGRRPHVLHLHSERGLVRVVHVMLGFPQVTCDSFLR